MARLGRCRALALLALALLGSAATLRGAAAQEESTSSELSESAAAERPAPGPAGSLETDPGQRLPVQLEPSVATPKGPKVDDGPAKSADDGRVTIVDNSNRLNMLAEKAQYDEATEAKMAKERLKADMEEHQKKMDSLAREEKAEQNGKNEEALKQKTAQVKAAHAKIEDGESAQKRAHEAKTKSDAKDAAAEQDRKRDELEKQQQAAMAAAQKEAAEKAAAHAKQKQALADGSWRKEGGGGGVVGIGSVPINLDNYANYGHGWAPAVAQRSGSVCLVRGLVRGPAGGQVATLAGDCRPTGGRLIFNQMVNGANARVDVLPDGRVFHITGNGNPHDYLSLSGMSFDTQQPARFTLFNGWVPYDHGYRDIVLTRFGSLCMLSGLIRNGHWGGIAQVSNDCRPSERLVFSGNNHVTATRLDLLTDGIIHYVGGTANHGWVSLDGIIYAPGGGGRDIQLVNGRFPYGHGYRAPRYERAGSVCSLSGLVNGAHAGHVATLPGDCRPPGPIIFSGNNHENGVRLDVHPNGQIHLVGGSNHGWFSLSGVHFVVG